MTAALMSVFLTGYVSGLWAEGEVLESLFDGTLPLPPRAAFEPVWSLIYLLEILALTAAIADGRLRKLLKFWLAAGVMSPLACKAFFGGAKIFSLGLMTEITVLYLVITFKFAEKTKVLWLTTLPIALWHAYLTAINFLTVIP